MLIIFMLFSIAKQLDQDQIVFVHNNENFHTKHANSLIFDSDEKTIEQIKSLDFEFFKKTFQMEALGNGIILQILLLNSIQFQKESAFCVCQLLYRQSIYDIKCIDGVILGDNNTQLAYKKNHTTFSIKLTNDSLTKCNELFKDQKNQIIVFCQKEKLIEIHKLNLQQQTSIILKYNSSNYYRNCLQKFMNFQETILFSFYNCKEWTIFNISESNLQLFMDQTIFSRSLTNQQQIEYLREIQLCQNMIFLIESNFYYIIEVNKNIFNSYFQMHEKQILQLQINDHCYIKYFVVQNESENLYFNYSEKEVQLNIKNYLKIIFALNYLILIKEDQIMFVFSYVLNKTYNVQSTQLHHIGLTESIGYLNIQTPYLMYQINNQTNSAQFFEYFDYQRWISCIKSQLQPVYITPENIIQIKNNRPIQMEVTYQCQKIIKLDYPKTIYPYQSQLKGFNNQNHLIIKNISDNISNFTLCSFQSFFNIKRIIWVVNLDDLFQKTIFIFINQKNQLIILDCMKAEIIYKLECSGMKVHHHQQSILITKQNTNFFIHINYLNQIIENRFSLSSNIKQITQCIKTVIFKLNNSQIATFDLMRNVLSYLDKNLELHGLPVCFHQGGSYTIIQYEFYFIYKYKEKKYTLVQTENILIYDIVQEWSFIRIKAIHQIQDIIIVYQLNDQKLAKENEFSIEDYKLERPLIFGFNQDYLSLATFINEKKSILQLYVDNYIQIISHIYCISFQFLQIDNSLLYLDNQNIQSLYNYKFYQITLQLQPNQTEYFNIQNEKLQVSFNDFNKTYNFDQQIYLNILNKCYELFKLKNISVTKNNDFLNLKELFLGPANSIESQNTNHFKISGPFQIDQNIINCEESTSDTCFQIYQPEKNAMQQYFQFECLIKKGAYNYPLNCFSKTVLATYPNLFNYFLLFNNSILINTILNQTGMYFHFFKVDHYQFKLILIEQYELIQMFHFSNVSHEISQRKNLIIFNKKSLTAQTFLIYFDKRSYQILQQFEDLIDAYSYTENLFIIALRSQRKILLQVVSFQNSNIIIINQFFIEDGLREFLEIKKVASQAVLINYFMNPLIRFISSIYENNYLNCTVLLVLPEYSCEVMIAINLETESIQFEMLKVLRNPFKKQKIYIDYLDSNTLVLSDDSDSSYLYDMRCNNQRLDYISKYKNSRFQIVQIDTIFNESLDCSQDYLIKQLDIDKQFLGKIGYRVQLINQSSPSKNYLIVKNDISEIQIEIIFKMNEQENRNFKLIQYLLIILILISILSLLYILRRKKLRKNLKMIGA